MMIHCNVTGSERKRLAQVLGAILLFEPVYTKAPTFAYIVDDYRIDKDGTIFCPDSATPEAVAQIIDKLTDEGFAPEIEKIESVDEEEPASEGESAEDEAPAEIPAETPDVAPEAEAEAIPEAEAQEANVGAETPETAAKTAGAEQPAEVSATEDDQSAESAANEDVDEADAIPDENPDEIGLVEEDETKLTISIPRDKLADDALARLRMMVSNKEELFKRALLADDLSIEVTEKEVSFPWFTLTGIDGEAEAYAQFVTALCQMAIEQTRVLDKPYDGDNDRFAMRIFMVRLNMKGPQFALARRLMMKHLTGNSGWRYEDSASKPDRSNPNRTTTQHLKKAYPSDTRIELIPMNDEIGTDIQIGAHGRMVGVDDNGSVFIKLDNGSAFGIAFSTEQTNKEEVTASVPTLEQEAPYETQATEESEAVDPGEEFDVPCDDIPFDRDDTTPDDLGVQSGESIPEDRSEEDGPDTGPDTWED